MSSDNNENNDDHDLDFKLKESDLSLLGLENNKSIKKEKAKIIYKILIDNGITSLNDLEEKSSEIVGMSSLINGKEIKITKTIANKILAIVNNLYGATSLKLASNINDDLPIITNTGIPQIDAMFNGGFFPDSYSFYGEGGSGKSFMTLFLLIRAFAINSDTEFYAAVFDTEKSWHKYFIKKKTFSKGKIIPKESLAENICKSQGVDYEYFRKHVFISKNPTEDSLNSTINEALELKQKIKVIIVDSFSNPFRSARATSDAFGQSYAKKYATLLNKLLGLQSKHNAVLFITHQVYQNIGLFIPSFKKVLPYGGNVVKHALNVWVLLTDKGKGIHNLSIVDASHLQQSQINFRITSKGIELA